MSGGLTMNKTLEKIVIAGSIIACGALIGVAGCTSIGIKNIPSQYLEGTVIAEYGDINPISETNSKDKSAADPQSQRDAYVIKVQTSEGMYTIQINERTNLGYLNNHTSENLAAAIETGTKIKFALNIESMELFDKDNIGTVPPEKIEILGK
ncbi:MAG: hypothetical protein NTZ02_02880 [Candidatus Woesearchaeota archaeon]|nr:hypothetical protein [Candidatus Woesearchaeota archaeon]